MLQKSPSLTFGNITVGLSCSPKSKDESAEDLKISRSPSTTFGKVVSARFKTVLPNSCVRELEESTPNKSKMLRNESESSMEGPGRASRPTNAALLGLASVIYCAGFLSGGLCIIEPMSVAQHFHRRHGDFAPSRALLAIVSMCFAVHLFVSCTFWKTVRTVLFEPEDVACINSSENASDVFGRKHPSWHSNGMRRTASEPTIRRGILLSRYRSKEAMQDGFRRQEKKRVHFVKDEQSDGQATFLPDATEFRQAPIGWSSVMGSDTFHPFPPSEVATLSLYETAELFAFALDNGYNKVEGSEGNSVSKALAAMENAAVSVVPGIPSRDHQEMSKSFPNETGSVDALLFCAAMRLFADWRIVRQVPSGYNAYATGLQLGQKDVALNVKKIENAARAWLARRKSAHGTVIRRPTLRDLLEEEIDTDLHKGGLPKLEDDSAATGLLWARRQLEYQQKIYRNINDETFTSAREAVQAAYGDVYGKYHGWAVRNIFNFSARAAPPIDILLKHMMGDSDDYLGTGSHHMSHFCDIVEPLLDDLLQLLHELNMHDEGVA